MQVTFLLGRSGHHIGEGNELVGIKILDGEEVGLFEFHLVATAAEVALHDDLSITVPGLTLHRIGIIIGLRCIVVTAYLDIVVSIKGINAITLEHDVLSTSRHDECLKALTQCRVFLVDDDRSERTVAIRRHLQLVKNEIEREHGTVVGRSHLDVGGRDTGVALLVTSQYNGGLCCHSNGGQQSYNG